MEDFADDNPIRRFLKTSFTYGNTLIENNPVQNALQRIVPLLSFLFL